MGLPEEWVGLTEQEEGGATTRVGEATRGRGVGGALHKLASSPSHPAPSYTPDPGS